MQGCTGWWYLASVLRMQCNNGKSNREQIFVLVRRAEGGLRLPLKGWGFGEEGIDPSRGCATGTSPPLVADDITGEAAPDGSLTPGHPKGPNPNQNTGSPVLWALPCVSRGRAPRVISNHDDHVTSDRRFSFFFPPTTNDNCYRRALVDCFVENSLLVGDESRFAARRLHIHAKRWMNWKLSSPRQ